MISCYNNYQKIKEWKKVSVILLIIDNFITKCMFVKKY